jgi:hypothetical protein
MNPEQIADLFQRTEDTEDERVEFELSWSNIRNTQKAAASFLATTGDKVSGTGSLRSSGRGRHA